jgi:hypothetical protein
MVVFAFQYLAVNGLAYVGAAMRWLSMGGRVSFRTIRKDLYFNASIPAYALIIWALLSKFSAD